MNKKLYSKKYLYDKGINLLNIDYSGSQPSITQQAVQANSNRLLNTEYDPSGNQLSTNKLSGIGYDHHNQTIKTSWLHHQEYYGYANAGHRLKKLSFSQNEQGKTTKLEMVFYLGQTEFRKIYTGQDLSFDGQTVYDNKVAIEASNDKVESRIKMGHGQVAKLSRDQIIGKQDYAYNLLNHIDNNTAVLNPKSMLVNFQHFYPYGGISYSYGNLSNKQLGFSGQELDDSELNYYGYRYYDSDRGRWTQPDPTGFKSEQLNLYAMLNGKPIFYRDEHGLGFLKTLFFGWLFFSADLVKTDNEAVKTGDLISIQKMLTLSQNFLVGENHDFGFQYLGVDRVIANKIRSHDGASFGIYRELPILSPDVNDDWLIDLHLNEESIVKRDNLSYKKAKREFHIDRSTWQMHKMRIQHKSSDPNGMVFHHGYIAKDQRQNISGDILEILDKSKQFTGQRINFFNIGLSHLIFMDGNNLIDGFDRINNNLNYDNNAKINVLRNSFNLLKTFTDLNRNVSMLIVSPNGLDSTNTDNADLSNSFEIWWEFWKRVASTHGGLYNHDSTFDQTQSLSDFHPGYNIKVNSSILNNNQNWNMVKVLSYDAKDPRAPKIFMINAVNKEEREVFDESESTNENKGEL